MDINHIPNQPAIACSELTMKTLEKGVNCVQSSGLFIVNFKHISHLVLFLMPAGHQIINLYVVDVLLIIFTAGYCQQHIPDHCLVSNIFQGLAKCEKELKTMQEKSTWKVFEFGTFSAQFFSIWTEHGNLLFKSPRSVQMRQKYGIWTRKIPNTGTFYRKKNLLTQQMY